MTTVYRLIRIDFDNWENSVSDAITEHEIGLFVDDPNKTAYKKVYDKLMATPPIRPYLGHNMQVYPQWRVEEKRLS